MTFSRLSPSPKIESSSSPSSVESAGSTWHTQNGESGDHRMVIIYGQEKILLNNTFDKYWPHVYVTMLNINSVELFLKGYEVIGMLEKGTLGFSFKLKSTSSGIVYVLKMMECLDRTHAELILKEITCFQKFKHVCVPRLKKCFIATDKKTSAIYVVTLRKFIAIPSLNDLLLKSYKRTSIERRLIFRTFGFLLELLNSLKSSGILCLNLHPKNLFVNENAVYVSDIGCQNLFAYSRGVDHFEHSFAHLYDSHASSERQVKCPTMVQTERQKPIHTKWCAPELEMFQYTSRSDVWSLACIMQIMLNTVDLSEDMMDWALSTLKTKPENFFPFCNRSTEHEKDFVEILLSMLAPKPYERATLEQITQMPFVQDILAKTHPEALARAQRCLVSLADRPVPVNSGKQAVYDYLRDNWKYERCAEEAIVWLAEYCCHEGALQPFHMLSVVLHSMDLHILNKRLVLGSLVILRHAANMGQTLIHLHSDNGRNSNAEEFAILRIIMKAMKSHSRIVLIQQAGLHLLDTILGSFHASITNVLHEQMIRRIHVYDYLYFIGTTTYILELLTSHVKELAYLGVDHLWKYCVHERSAQQVAESKGLQTIIYLLRNYADEIRLYTGGPLLILSLSHFEHFAVHFAGIKEESHYQADGLDVLRSVYETQHDNIAVIEAVVHVLSAVIKYDDVLRARVVRTETLCGLLQDLASRFQDHEALIAATQNGLRKLAILA
ncbi:unnamed protein product [Dicrocoelium dendriticum]|nr:unnamed protein product [Dicrocoelium dendriticum]